MNRSISRAYRPSSVLDDGDSVDVQRRLDAQSQARQERIARYQKRARLAKPLFDDSHEPPKDAA